MPKIFDFKFSSTFKAKIKFRNAKNKDKDIMNFVFLSKKNKVKLLHEFFKIEKGKIV